ncbi:unnamed protein product [Musa acuminata subsp. burmannicoides]
MGSDRFCCRSEVADHEKGLNSNRSEDWGVLSPLSSLEHFVLHCVIPSSCIRTSQSRSPTFYCDDIFMSHPDSSEKARGRGRVSCADCVIPSSPALQSADKRRYEGLVSF